MADLNHCTAACPPFQTGHDPYGYHHCELSPGHQGEHVFPCLDEPGSLPVAFTYTNHRGLTARPEKIWFGTTEWHKTPQWMLRAFDVSKEQVRDFAMSEISLWGNV